MSFFLLIIWASGVFDEKKPEPAIKFHELLLVVMSNEEGIELELASI